MGILMYFLKQYMKGNYFMGKSYDCVALISFSVVG